MGIECKHPDECVTDDLRCQLCGADIIKRLNELNRHLRGRRTQDEMPPSFEQFMRDFMRAFSRGERPWEDSTPTIDYVERRFGRE